MKKYIKKIAALVLLGAAIFTATASITFADTPPAITGLTVSAKTANSATLSWNLGSPTADSSSVYDVRYSTQVITSANFASSTSGAPAGQGGVIQSSQVSKSGVQRVYTVTGLSVGTTYYFAVESGISGTWSPMSNVASAQITEPTPASVPNSGGGTSIGNNNSIGGYDTGVPLDAQGNPLNVVTIGSSATYTGTANLGSANGAPGSAATAPATKDNYSGLVKCSGVALAGETECNFNTLISTIANLINWAFYISLPIAVALFSWAGILYISGVESNISKAHAIFLNTAIGFIIMLVAFTCVHTVLGWLVDPSIGSETFLSN
jgi:hypothetical protein